MSTSGYDAHGAHSRADTMSGNCDHDKPAFLRGDEPPWWLALTEGDAGTIPIAVSPSRDLAIAALALEAEQVGYDYEFTLAEMTALAKVGPDLGMGWTSPDGTVYSVSKVDVVR
jgi:hypothetical protein